MTNNIEVSYLCDEESCFLPAVKNYNGMSLCRIHYNEKREEEEDMMNNRACEVEKEMSNSSRDTNDRPTGGSTHYYELPKGATELHELIHYKKMTHSIGEAFSALYRLNDNGEYTRNLEKVIFYAQLELDRFNEAE